MSKPLVRNRLLTVLLAAVIWLWMAGSTAAQEGNGILWPEKGKTFNGVVEISGVAAHPTFRKWQLDLLINGEEKLATFLAVGEDELTTRTVLTTIDVRQYPRGSHLLRLRVVHSNLNYDEYSTPVIFGAPTPSTKPADDPAPTLTKETKPAIPTPKANDITFTPPADNGRWIEVDISEQILRAWQGDQLVMDTLVSTGRATSPTVVGVFSVERKLESQRMRGPGYDLPNVTSVMYFYWNYAIHGAYWHNNFGQVMSHGCVNMREEEALTLYNWAEVGTPVYVHE